MVCCKLKSPSSLNGLLWKRRLCERKSKVHTLTKYRTSGSHFIFRLQWTRFRKFIHPPGNPTKIGPYCMSCLRTTKTNRNSWILYLIFMALCYLLAIVVYLLYPVCSFSVFLLLFSQVLPYWSTIFKPSRYPATSCMIRKGPRFNDKS